MLLPRSIIPERLLEQRSLQRLLVNADPAVRAGQGLAHHEFERRQRYSGVAVAEPD